MRRKDREMDREFGLGVMDKARFATLGMVDEKNGIYAVPVSPARVGNSIYLHSAKEGTKLDCLRKNPEVTMVFVGDVHVPAPITKEEYEKFKKENRMGMLTSSKFTTEYESVVIRGRAHFIDEEEEMTLGLRSIAEKFTPFNMEYFQEAVTSGLPRTQVLRIDIEEITAKRKKFDDKGEEMKWGRLE